MTKEQRLTETNKRDEVNDTVENSHWQTDRMKLRKKVSQNESIQKLNTDLWTKAKTNFIVYYNTGFEYPLIEGSSALLDMNSFNLQHFDFKDIMRFIFRGYETGYLNENKTELSGEGIFKLNNIIHKAITYCKEEGLNDNSFTKKYKEIEEEYNNKIAHTILGNSVIINKGKQSEIALRILTLNQLKQLFKITEEYGNREAFFYRTMFIAAQLENSDIYQNKEQYYQKANAELRNFMNNSPKEIKIKLIGNIKSDNSTITKISKDPEYSHINQLKDIIRFTYVIGDHKNPEEDIKQCLQVFAQFDKNYKGNTDKNIKITEIKNKFGDLYNQDEQGKYLYIDNKKGNGDKKIAIIQGIDVQIPEAKKKDTSGDEYQDLKMIVEFAGIPCEIKFITPQRNANNDKGMSNHDLMRLTENINKTARKYGFISRKYIEKRVEKERPKNKQDIDGITQEIYINNILKEHYTEITPPNGEEKKDKDTYYVNNKRLKRRNTLLRDSNTEEQDYLKILQNIIYEPKVEDIRNNTLKGLKEALIS